MSSSEAKLIEWKNYISELFKALEVNKDILLIFIDYKKAVDSVKYGKLFEILANSRMDRADIRIIINLYEDQKAHLRVDGQNTSEIGILRRVRQSCVLSPDNSEGITITAEC